MQSTINTSVCVYSSHYSIGDLMSIAVDQKDRVLERTCNLYILKSIASDSYHLRQLRTPHLCIYCTYEFYP